MTLPANIRINTQVNFPSLVSSTGPVTVTKKNGVWTIGLSFGTVGTQAPQVSSFATDYVLVWDSITGSIFRMSLSNIGIGRSQRLVTAGPVVFAGGDQIVNLKLAGSFSSALPSYVTRSGVPLTICDVSLLYGAAFHAQTFTAAAGETIDGAASIQLAEPGQSITLLPMNDGTSAGWKQI
jgi:hypothetical protein